MLMNPQKQLTPASSSMRETLGYYIFGAGEAWRRNMKLLLAILLAVAPIAALAQKPKPSKKATTPPPRISREFRKAAMLAKLAVKKVGDNYTEPVTSYKTYADDADRALTITEAEVVTRDDRAVHLLLIKYYHLTLSMRLQDYASRRIDYDEAKYKGIDDRFRECGHALDDIFDGGELAGGSACESTGPWDKRDTAP